MEQPFIYKYRPKTLEDFEINPKLIELINKLIASDILNILLIGNQGCGKTTLINCIIKKYYGDLYDSNNILIINSLKEQGITFYKTEVKTFCQTMSSIPNKKKIIILDDIDNINEQGQQVFKNCIDKYSKNVNFIASCCNIQKVIDSYQSKQIIIKINPLEQCYLKSFIQKICKKEEIHLDSKAEEFLLVLSNNSIQTAISYLEKFKLLNSYITYTIAVNACTNISFTEFTEYINLCKTNNLSGAIDLITTIYNNGFSVLDILDNLFIFIKMTESIVEKDKYEIIKLICKYIIVFYNIHEEEIELIMFTNNLIKLFDVKPLT
jgi:DNA polymerase III delta prime subunit